MVTQIDCINAALKDSDDIHVDHIGTVRTYLALMHKLLSAGITPSMLEKLASGDAWVAEWVSAKGQGKVDSNGVLGYLPKHRQVDGDMTLELYTSTSPKHMEKYLTFNGSSEIPTPKGDSK